MLNDYHFLEVMATHMTRERTQEAERERLANRARNITHRKYRPRLAFVGLRTTLRRLWSAALTGQMAR